MYLICIIETVLNILNDFQHYLTNGINGEMQIKFENSRNPKMWAKSKSDFKYTTNP